MQRPIPDPDISPTSDRDYLSNTILHLTEVIHGNPDDQRALFLRGNAYLDTGDFEAAITDYTRVTESDTSDAVALNNRGIAHRGLADPDSAIADYNKALDLDAN